MSEELKEDYLSILSKLRDSLLKTKSRLSSKDLDDSVVTMMNYSGGVGVISTSLYAYIKSYYYDTILYSLVQGGIVEGKVVILPYDVVEILSYYMSTFFKFCDLNRMNLRKSKSYMEFSIDKSLYQVMNRDTFLSHGMESVEITNKELITLKPFKKWRVVTINKLANQENVTLVYDLFNEGVGISLDLLSDRNKELLGNSVE